jgi:hypothetical protein
MATACLRLFTFPPLPPLPDFNDPALYSCITFLTFDLPLVELFFDVLFLAAGISHPYSQYSFVSLMTAGVFTQDGFAAQAMVPSHTHANPVDSWPCSRG